VFDSIRNRTSIDHRQAVADKPYAAGPFARKHGITRDQARRPIKKFRHNRAKLDASIPASQADDL
jgi:hypothetical protein